MRQLISTSLSLNAQSHDRAPHPTSMSRAASASAGPSSAVQRSECWAELAAFRASLLPDLPDPVSIWIAIEGAPVPVQLTTSVLTSPQGSLAPAIVFDGEELRALVAGIEADRIWRKDLLALCFDKWRRPEYRLTRDDALAGANPDPGGWSLERVLARVGAAITHVELCGDESRREALPAAA